MKDLTIVETVHKQLQDLKVNHTYRELAEASGLEQTRLYRIIEGAEMKLHEVQTLVDKGLVVLDEFQKKPVQFDHSEMQEFCRSMMGLKQSDFALIFEDGDIDHLWSQFVLKGPLSFFCYLDSENVIDATNFIMGKMQKNKEVAEEISKSL